VFDGYKAPSFLATPGAKDVGVEIFTLSKSYNMPGWRVGFVCGNKEMVQALTHLKGYLDYGMFQPIQIASIIALNSDDSVVHEISDLYKVRRDVLIEGLNRIGWQVEKPKATMFAWAKIPDKFKEMGSIEFSKLLLKEAKVAVSPGIGFGREGDTHVRFALVENEHRTRQAVRGIKGVLG
jgi:alanine-synthesizing transaminase